MSLLAIAALAVMSASPPSGVAVVAVGRSGLTQAEAAALVERISAKLSAGGLPLALSAEAVTKKLAAAGISDSASCEGQLSCARDLGAILGVAVVVAIDIGALRKSLTIQIQAVSVRDGKRIAQRDFTVERKTVLGELPMLADFMTDTRGALATAPPSPVDTRTPATKEAPKDAPVEAKLAPTHAPTDGVVVKEGPGPIPTAAWATGAAAAGAGVGAAVFAALGASAQAQLGTRALPDGRTVVSVPEPQARALATAANTDYSVALGAAVGCAVLSGVTAWLIVTR